MYIMENAAITKTEISRRYEFIVNTSKELMSLVNRDYEYEAVNDEHCRARNQKREEILGRTIAELWDDEVFQSTIKEPLERCFSGHEVNYQAYYEHAAKGLRYMDVTYYPYYNAASIVTHAVVVQRDITEQERAERAIHRYARRLETLHEVDRGILAAQSPEEIAEAALQHLQFLVPFQLASIVMFERRHLSDAMARNGNLMLYSKGGDSSSSRGQVFDIENTQVLASLDLADLLNEDSSAVSFINIPLIAQGELLGSLSLGSRNTATFSGEHGDIAREVASQVAMAVQQSQLRQVLRRYTNDLEVMVQERTQEIERRRQVAEGMQDILTILNSRRPVDEVLSYILTQARMLLETDWVTFFSTPENGDELEMLSVRSLNANALSTDEMTFSYRLTRLSMSSRQPMKVRKLRSHRHHEPHDELWEDIDVERVRYESILAVPLSANQEVYGAIILYSIHNYDYSDEEVATATSLADQAALAIENARLHQRAERLAVMEERERLARDLHDSVTQSIYSLTLFSEAGQRVMRAGDDQLATEYLEQLGVTASQALKEMRLLLYELRPVILEQEGLVEALRRRLEAVEKRAGVHVQYDVVDPIVLPPATEEGLYRIAQEALNNSLKHSGADLVKARIFREAHGVTMEIFDNGQGFIFGEAQVSGGMGLLNMRERAQKLNGNLMIRSEPNEGTTITVTIDTEDNFNELLSVNQHKLIRGDRGK